MTETVTYVASWKSSGGTYLNGVCDVIVRGDDGDYGGD